MKTDARWKNRYDKFIELRSSIPKDGYVERHHVIPKCLGGNNDPDNLVILSAREHFIAHWMLTKVYPDSRKLKYALVCMSTHKNQRKLKSRHYQICKIANSKAGLGRTVSKETRLKMRKLRHTTKTKNVISKCQTGQKHHYFKGYYIVPNSNVKFESSKEVSKFCKIDGETVLKIFRNRLDKVVTRQAYAQNAFLKSLGNTNHVVGKTYTELGFSFEKV